MKEESAIKDLKKQAYFAVAWRAQASAHSLRIGSEGPWSLISPRQLLRSGVDYKRYKPTVRVSAAVC